MSSKSCFKCLNNSHKLFRIRYLRFDKKWYFVCESCLPSVKSNNKFYQYGGTWKG